MEGKCIRQETDAGKSRCPCLDKDSVDYSPIIKEDCPGVVHLDEKLDPYCVRPRHYGLGACEPWDLKTEPYCADADGQEAEDAALWCKDPWCYVDVDACDLDPKPSYFFPDVKGPNGGPLHYSYTTCGDSDEGFNFAKWAASKDMTANEIVDEVEKYVEDFRKEAERWYAAVIEDESDMGCEYINTCDCGTCTKTIGWTDDDDLLSVDFREVSVTKSAYSDADEKASWIGECMSGQLKRKFKKVVNDEYSSTKRVAYIYYGSHLDGALIQWPALQWCPQKYDARLRPWYVTATAGPKDLVIVVDSSGSMRTSRGNGLDARWPDVKKAVGAILKTLTNYDYAYLLLFDSMVTKMDDDSLLVKMTEDNKEFMNEFLDEHSPIGNTNFAKGFEAAFEVLDKSKAEGSHSSGCNQVILFLTDGEDTSGLETGVLLGKIKEHQEARDPPVSIFTYAFGTEAKNQDLTKKIACQNSGVGYMIEDDGNLGDVMSKYYEYFANGETSDKKRWVQYEDASTGDTLLACCAPAYDQTKNHPTVAGAICMDLNIMLTIEDLKTRPGYDSFWKRVEDESKVCKSVRHSDQDLQRIRGEHKCEACDMTDKPCPTAEPSPAPSQTSRTALAVLGHILLAL